jgi:hypothetical protein
MSVSTWSCVLLQNEHLGTSSSWRLPNMIPVCRGSGGSQDPQKLKLALLVELRLYGFSEDRKMLRLDAERLLAVGWHFSQIKCRKRWFAPYLARFLPP